MFSPTRAREERGTQVYPFPWRNTLRALGHLAVRREVLGNECGVVSEFVDSFQPTTQPTRTYVLYDSRVVWQSPRSCKLL